MNANTGMNPCQNEPLKIAVVTGSRADFGLLEPVIDAIQAHPDLEPLVIAAGAHLIQPALTFRDVKKRFAVADSVPMQTVGRTGRWHDAQALGKGVSRFARSFELLSPDCVLVLGDRIEAFAAASAASIGGVPVAHIHGGDRAEGVADEAMRHGITKLAHIHFAATELSRERILKMGERPEHVFNVGSPALDGLDRVEPMTDEECDELFGDGFRPETVVLHHPCGLTELQELATIEAILDTVQSFYLTKTVFLAPNHDPGREAIYDTISRFVGSPRDYESTTATRHPIEKWRARNSQWLSELEGKGGGLTSRLFPKRLDSFPGQIKDASTASSPESYGVLRDHLPRRSFLRLLARIARVNAESCKAGLIGGAGAMIGNSSAGLIEAAALRVPVLNVGPRQSGRETPKSVVSTLEDIATKADEELRGNETDEGCAVSEVWQAYETLDEYRRTKVARLTPGHHPYGDGTAGTQIADALATPGLISQTLLRKRNTY